jgi:hypothetical protein
MELTTSDQKFEGKHKTFDRKNDEEQTSGSEESPPKPGLSKTWISSRPSSARFTIKSNPVDFDISKEKGCRDGLIKILTELLWSPTQILKFSASEQRFEPTHDCLGIFKGIVTFDGFTSGYTNDQLILLASIANRYTRFCVALPDWEERSGLTTASIVPIQVITSDFENSPSIVDGSLLEDAVKFAFCFKMLYEACMRQDAFVLGCSADEIKTIGRTLKKLSRNLASVDVAQI